MQEVPRLAPTTETDWDPETRGIVVAAGRLNVFTTLAHHPKLLKRWLVFAAHILGKSSLPEREREILILRAGFRCGSAYEFGQHTVIGKRAGLSDDEIRRLAREGTAGWPEPDAELITAVDELLEKKCLGEKSWQTLCDRFTTEQVMDLVFTVGQYTMLAMALNSFGVQLEPGTPGFPA